MSYFSKSSNLFSIRSAIEEFKQVILVQNQVITTLQTALNASVLRVDALETTTASNTSAIAGQTSSITANTTAIAANATELVTMDSIVSYNTTLILRNQTDFPANHKYWSKLDRDCQLEYTHWNSHRGARHQNDPTLCFAIDPRRTRITNFR